MDDLDRAVAEFHKSAREHVKILANIRTLWNARDPRPHGTWKAYVVDVLKISPAHARRLLQGVFNGHCNKELRSAPRGALVTKAEHPKKSQIRQILTSNPERTNTEIAEELASDRGVVRRLRAEMGLPPSKGIRGPKPQNNSGETPASIKSQEIIPTPEQRDLTVKQAVAANQYPSEILDWIRTYLGWSKKEQKLGREVFFAAIHGALSHVDTIVPGAHQSPMDSSDSGSAVASPERNDRRRLASNLQHVHTVRPTSLH